MIKKFSWDENKRVANLKKHSLDFVIVDELFDGRPGYVYPSPRKDELRFVTVGIVDYTIIAAVWMERDDTKRIISLGRARDGEKRTYRELYDDRT